MHRTLRPTKSGDPHEQSILALLQSVSAPAQLDSFFRMQRMAHLMRLRALTIVSRPGRDRFSHNSILTSSAGGCPASSEHHIRYRNDLPALEQWVSARAVLGVPRPAEDGAEPPVGGGGTPGAGGEVRPAA